MTDAFVELHDLPVLRVRAGAGPAGPTEAFSRLESRLPTLRGRRLYGMVRPGPPEFEYYACVVRLDSDDPVSWGLETGVIPGGWYARRRVRDWSHRVGELPALFRSMAEHAEVDPDRPSLEFYRREEELLLYLPIRGAPLEAHGMRPARLVAAGGRAGGMEDEGRTPPRPTSHGP